MVSVRTRALVLLGVIYLILPSLGQATPRDVGIFADLNHKVALRIAPWLKARPKKLYLQKEKERAILVIDGIPTLHIDWVKEPSEALKNLLPEQMPSIPGGPEFSDQDKDGIPDDIDVMRGARKTVLNGAKYLGGYQRLTYPGGDVPRDRGVCTDVVVRALRNGGFDLQSLIYRDMKKAPTAYGLRTGQRPDRHIEHRRVRRQIIFFKRHYKKLTPQFSPLLKGDDAYRPGDIVFMDTLPKSGPDHVGIVSDKVDENGRPLIINNWDDGYKTQDMALLGSIPITHRFRMTKPK